MLVGNPQWNTLMKTSKKDLDIFITEVKRLMKDWELNNWQVAFEHKRLIDTNARIKPQLGDYKATFALSTDISYGPPFINEQTKEEYIKKLAQHEVIHLLLSRLSVVGQSRYITDAEQEEAEEELVHKIMHILDSIHNQKP